LRGPQGHSDSVTCVAFSPDGKLALSGSADNKVKLWDLSNGALLRTLEGHTDDVSSVAFSPDAKQALSGSSMDRDRTVKLWDLSSGALLKTLKTRDDVGKPVAFSPDAKLALTSTGGSLVLWDPSSDPGVRMLEGHKRGYSINSALFSPDGTQLLSGSDDRTLRLWDCSTGKTVKILEGHEKYVRSVVFSPDGKSALSGGSGSLILWDLTDGKARKTLETGELSYAFVAISRDGKLALSAGIHRDGRYWETMVKVWDLSTGTALHELKGDLVFSGVVFGPDDKGVLIAEGGVIKLWNPSGGQK